MNATKNNTPISAIKTARGIVSRSTAQRRDRPTPNLGMIQKNIRNRQCALLSYLSAHLGDLGHIRPDLRHLRSHHRAGVFHRSNCFVITASQ